jgi:hypothetical protein
MKLLIILFLIPNIAFCKLLQHDKVKITGGEYSDCTGELALDEDEKNDKYALRNIVCYHEGGIRITVFTLTWVPKVDVEKLK